MKHKRGRRPNAFLPNHRLDPSEPCILTPGSQLLITGIVLVTLTDLPFTRGCPLRNAKQKLQNNT